jgi:23S rRNA (pseudouridine1915-N3)-methyltransferase
VLRTKFQIVTPWEVQTQGVFSRGIEFYLARLRTKGTCEHLALRQNANDESIFDPLLLNFRKSQVAVACLDERAEPLTSEDFAKWIADSQAKGMSTQAFVLGGAYGLPASLANDGQLKAFKLSDMTLPHELALLVLVEQLYRAQCILSNHPYHHAEPSPFSKAVLKKPSKLSRPKNA